MVITGFEIFGAANGALGTLRLIVGLLTSLASTVHEYRRAARKLLELRDGFNSFIARLKNWTEEIWGINGEGSDQLYEAYWGREGWETVRAQLTTINTTCDEFADIISKLVDLDKLRDLEAQVNHHPKIPKAKSPISNDVKRWKLWRRKERNDSVEQHKELGRQAKKAITVPDKANFVLFKSKRLSEYLKNLNEWFSILYRDANDFYIGVHKKDSSDTSVEEKRRAAAASMILNFVFQTKAATEALYWSCTELGIPGQNRHALEWASTVPRQAQPKLEMNLALEAPRGSADAQSGPRLRYHLIVAWPDVEQHFEILAEGPMDSSSSEPCEAEQLVPVDSLSSACARLESQAFCDLIAQIAQDHSLTAMFRVEKPIDLIQVQSRRAIDLWNLLHKMKNDDVRFHLPDQISLVFKVVQSGLLLLGTSWLSNLTSKNIQRISDDDYDETSRFLLNAAASPFDDLTTVEPQTFKVGVLMAEIALALPIERIQSQQTGNGSQLEFVMNFSSDSIPDIQAFTADVIVYDVYLRAGKRYSRAVEFCLQQSARSRRSDWARIKQFGSWQDRDKAYHDIVVDYYNEVYVP